MLETNVYLILGGGCNLNCKFCFIHALKRFSSKDAYAFNSEWTINTLLEVINYNKEKNIKTNIIFFGGEPLLYIDSIFSIVKTLLQNIEIQNWFRFSITTNLVHANSIEYLTKLKELTKSLEVSVSYNTNEQYTSITYTKFIHNISQLRDNNIDFKLISILKDDLIVSKLEEIILLARPNCIQYEKLTINGKVVECSKILKHDLLLLAKKYEDLLGIELVCTCKEVNNKVGCYRNNNCSSITLDIENSCIYASCPKVLGLEEENLYKFSNIQDAIEKRIILEEDALKKIQICSKCELQNRCSAFCRISGCMNLEKNINWS